MFLENPESNFLLDLEECSSDSEITYQNIHHYFTYEYNQLDVAKFGKELFHGLKSVYTNDLFAAIDKITDKDSFVQFLNLLAEDYVTNQSEWENKSVIDFIEAMSSWTEDFSASPANDIDWDKVDYKTMAKILYTGKLYE